MSEHVPAHIQVGDPAPAGGCPRCGQDSLYRAALAAILPTGVQEAGSITVCADCDSPVDAVTGEVPR